MRQYCVATVGTVSFQRSGAAARISLRDFVAYSDSGRMRARTMDEVGEAGFDAIRARGSEGVRWPLQEARQTGRGGYRSKSE